MSRDLFRKYEFNIPRCMCVRVSYSYNHTSITALYMLSVLQIKVTYLLDTAVEKITSFDGVLNFGESSQRPVDLLIGRYIIIILCVT